MRNLILALSLLASFSARSATNEELQTRIQNFIDGTIIPTLQSNQVRRFNATGQYWQGLSTHTDANTPRHTTAVNNDTIPDNTARRPTQETETWEQFLGALGGSAIPCAIECHIYGGPRGQGYEIVVIYFFDGVRWRKTVNNGPEPYRNRDWSAERASTNL